MTSARAAGFSASVFAGLMLWSFIAPPAEAREVALIGGQGDGVDVWGISVRTPAWRSWEFANGSGANLTAEIQLADWRASEDTPSTPRNLISLSFTPVLSWTAPRDWKWRPYAEAGLGIHALSHTQINRDRKMSTGFQFGELLGVGVQFGERYAVGLRVQHVSNGGIKRPNAGVTFGEVLFRMRFD